MTTNLGRKMPPANAPALARDDQILSLLNKLGDQLIRSERERMQLGQKLSQLEAQQQEQSQTLSQKVDNALNVQNRKIEQVSQDKVRLIRKLERIEEAVVETREALQSKALVLLTDQGAAARSGQPQLPADPNKLLPPPARAAFAWQKWRAAFTNRQLAWAAAAAIVLLLGGWAIAHVPFSDSGARDVAAMPPQPLPAMAETAQPAAPVPANTTATALNNVAPAASPSYAVAHEEIAPSLPASKKAAAPQNAAEIDAFIAQQRQPGTLKSRMNPDPALPALARQIEKKAFDGVPEAEHDLAAIYTAGHAGVTPDYKKAAFWFREAAIQGVANARYNLGVLYQQGMGVPKDLGRALGWYAAAAQLGHPEAEYNLGIAYVEGVGAAYDPARAAQFFTAAAKGGVVEAAYNLGLIQENGMLGTANKSEALYWYKRAADHGSKEGAVALAQLSRRMGLSAAAVDKIVADLHHDDAPVTADHATSLSPVMAAPTIKKHAAPIKVTRSEETPAPEPVSVDNHSSDTALVAQIQEQLMKRGLLPGPADGHENAVTSDAIRAYESANHLPDDGRVSPALLNNLLSGEAPPPQQTADNGLHPDDRQNPTP